MQYPAEKYFKKHMTGVSVKVDGPAWFIPFSHTAARPHCLKPTTADKSRDSYQGKAPQGQHAARVEKIGHDSP